MKTKVICTTLLIEKSPQALPLGAACIASAIKNSDLTKEICQTELKAFCIEDKDYILHAKTPDSAAQYLAENLEADIICFSVFVWNRIILEKAARLLRQKGKICIAGGPEVTANPQSFVDFDFITTGEGELRVPYLISKIIAKDKAALQDDTLSTILKDMSCPLEKLSSPYLDGTLDPSDYEGALWELARGCPFKCSYCYESKGEKKVRRFPIERIEKELDLFARKKIPQVFVLDPTYNANKEQAIKLLNLIAKKTPDTFYYFEARAEFIDRQMAQAFTKIPCALQIGLQSANEEVLKLVNRPYNRKQFVKNINYLNEAGVIFGFDLIYGLPGESFKSFKEGIDFALSLYPNNLEIFCLSVLPGTDLFDRAEELHLNYSKTPPYNIINTDKISNTDLQHASHLAKACTIFYNDGRAVPWFNIVTRHLRMRAPDFFDRFYKEYFSDKGDRVNCHDNGDRVNCSNQAQIEELQVQFVTKLCREKHLDRYIKVITDLIRYNGAVSRKTDTGKDQNVRINYPEEFLCSEYIFDLEFFINNVRIKPSSIRV